MSIEKSTKKDDFNCPKILRLMLFDKFFCRFSSLLDIYKFIFLRYNNTRRGAIALRVPSFAHRGSIPVKCQSHDIPLSRTEQRCAFLIFQASVCFRQADFLRTLIFKISKNRQNMGSTPHLPPKNSLFLQLCTTLLTSNFGLDIMEISEEKIISKTIYIMHYLGGKL